MLSPATLDLVDFQEFQRFQNSEIGLKEFESKYFNFKTKISPRGKPSEVVQAGFECAIAAAKVSINDYNSSSHPYVETILDDAKTNSGGSEFFDSSDEAKKIRAQFETDLNAILTLRTRDYL